MAEWISREKTLNTFEYHETKYKGHIISLTRLGDTRYNLRWYRGVILEIKEPFDAATLDEAKTYAITTVRNYISTKAFYWQNRLEEFNDWFKEGLNNGQSATDKATSFCTI